MVEFAEYKWLLLLLTIVPVVFVWTRSEAAMGRARQRASLAFRILLIVCAVLALSDVRLRTRSDSLSVLYLVDRSKSASLDERNWETVKQFVAASLEKKAREDRAGIAVFGKYCLIERSVSEGFAPLTEIHSMVNSNSTDISGALRTASGIIPEYGAKRIVLFTDGNEIEGRALDNLEFLKSNGIAVDVVPFDSGIGNEAMLVSMSVPARVARLQPFDVRIGVSSTVRQTAKLYLYRDSNMLAEQDVELSGGEEFFRFKDKIQDGGTHEYKAVLAPASDILSANNHFSAFCRVKTEPKILYCTEDGEGLTRLAETLISGGISLDVVTPSMLPLKEHGILKYDALIFDDVSYAKIGSARSEFINSYVKNTGGGFVMVGGLGSFGAGGYAGTDIDDILPVDCDVKKKENLADVAMVVVLDQSGSMGAIVQGGQSKMQLANQAAAEAVDVLTGFDSVGVLAVDESPKWVTALEKIGDRNAVKDRILSNRPGGGGIYIYSGVHEAGEALKKYEASLRHILLFADGSDSEQKENCFEYVQDLVSNFGVTLSVVSIGIGCDSEWLEQLSRIGSGRFYVTEDANELPRIFLTETFLSSRAAVVEKDFRPVVNSATEMMKGIGWDEAPELKGYAVTSRKPSAEVLAEAMDGDPLVARWQSGLGRSLAFTSDAKPKWAERWMEWEGFVKFWQQSARWVMRNVNEDRLQTSIVMKDDRCIVTADFKDTEGNPVNLAQIRLKTSTPDGKTVETSLLQSGIGSYSCEFPIEDFGDYYFTLFGDGGEVFGTYAKSISYPLEFRRFGTNAKMLMELASGTGGKYAPAPEDAFVHDISGTPQSTRMWKFFLVMSLAFLLLDVAARRMFSPVAFVMELVRGERTDEDVPVSQPSQGSTPAQGHTDRPPADEDGVEERLSVKGPEPDAPEVPEAVAEKEKASPSGAGDVSSETMRRLLDVKGRLKKKK